MSHLPSLAAILPAHSWGRKTSIVLTRRFVFGVFTVQGVHEQINCEPSPTEWAKDGSDRESKIVFIGLGLDKDDITENLKTCLAPEQ